MSEPAYEGWAMLELFGHRKLGGYVREAEMYGGKFCRIDTPELEAVPAGPYQQAQPAMASQTQFYGEKAIYCVTPCSEQVAKSLAARIRHQAVSTYDQQRLIEGASAASEHDDDHEPASGLLVQPAGEEDRPW